MAAETQATGLPVLSRVLCVVYALTNGYPDFS